MYTGAHVYMMNYLCSRDIKTVARSSLPQQNGLPVEEEQSEIANKGLIAIRSGLGPDADKGKAIVKLSPH